MRRSPRNFRRPNLEKSHLNEPAHALATGGQILSALFGPLGA